MVVSFYKEVVNKSCSYFSLNLSSEGISICLPKWDFLWQSSSISDDTSLAGVDCIYT